MITMAKYLPHENSVHRRLFCRMTVIMEVTITKRFFLILTVLLLCFCLPAWAEETGETPAAETVAEESEASSLDDGDASFDDQPSEELPQEKVEDADQDLDEEIEDEPTLPTELEEEETAEPQPSTGHTADHQTLEVVHEMSVVSIGSPDLHRVKRTYDLYCNDCQQVIQESCRVEEITEPHAFQLVSRIAPTCIQEGQEEKRCSLCGDDYIDVLPVTGHEWSDWEDMDELDGNKCISNRLVSHRCNICGLEETAVIPAPGHQWVAVSYTEATCVEDGEAVRRCAVCGLEETLVLPAYGHTYVQKNSDPDGQLTCAICGEAKETVQAQSKQSHMYYNNTVTSFGPTTRELIGGSVWNRVTPVDLSQEGVFTYPLIASNQYTIGTATLVNGQDSQEVQYKLSSTKINVHSESLVVYPDLEALKTGNHAISFDFNEPIDLKGCFGKDARVIVAITLKADYDADSVGVRRFSADQKWIDQMMEMIK